MKQIKIILIILLCSSFCQAQEIDSLMRKIAPFMQIMDSLIQSEMDLETDSYYRLLVELKAKQGALSDCDFAIKNATHDFNEMIFTLYYLEFSGSCGYCAVLKQDYDIQVHFINDLFSEEYYRCYNSIMSKELIKGYGCDIFEAAKLKADSLKKTDKWISDIEYIGGEIEMYNFITSKLSIDTDITELKATISINISIDSTGRILNIEIIHGVNPDIDKKIVDIIKKMPNWKPAYLYGKPIGQLYLLPLHINYP